MLHTQSIYIDNKDTNKRTKNIYSSIKRILDIMLAILAMIILFPAMIIISIFIKLDSKGPIIFKQVRTGQYGKEFTIYKFRTMKLGTPNVPTAQINKTNCVITKVGKILRKTSLDEIPQLVNILRGEMSFVGPRPLINTEKRIIKLRKQCGVDKLTPGITGWAQVNGRDELDIYKKVEYDYEYYQKRSVIFDIKILIITVIKVLKAEGIKEG